MILVYGGCLTPCSCSWRSNWRSSSIYVQPQQQRQQQQALSICKSSGNVVVILGDVCEKSGCPSTTINSGFSSLKTSTTTTKTRKRRMTIVVAIAVVVSTATVMLSVMSPNADSAELITTSSSSSSLSKQQQQRRQQQLSQMEMDETLLDIPQTLSSQDGEYCSSSSSSSSPDCKKKPRIQRPKSRKAESCTIKCVTTCIRGSNGGGSPGEGPLNIRRPLVVFKEGFRSRQYCLIECSDICNLINEGDSGP